MKFIGISEILCFLYRDVDVKVFNNEDGTFTVYYKLLEPGDYTLNVKFGGQPVPDGLCAFTVNA